MQIEHNKNKFRDGYFKYTKKFKIKRSGSGRGESSGMGERIYVLEIIGESFG